MDDRATDRRTSRLAFFALGSAGLVFVLVYATAVGHGFVLDDFSWIMRSRARQTADWPRLFLTSIGFYRPLVALSFAANYALFGNHPLGYGLTNLALAILCGALIARLLLTVGLARGPAIFGAFVWLLNFHGINMAILWNSGRTALLLIAGSVAAAIAVVEGKIVLAVLCLLAALFSKEEAVMLPAVLVTWGFLLKDRPRPTAETLKLLLGAALALTVYLILRAHSGAMTPLTAPDYYRPTFEPTHVFRNFTEYADRTLTFAAVVTLLALAVLGRGNPGTVRWDIVKCALVWIVGSFALTLFVPGRSSLYVCLPSVGSALMSAAVVANLWNRATQDARRRALVLAIVIPLVCAPLYVARNGRYVDLAEFSARALADMEALTADLPADAPVVLIDDRTSRVNLESTFGTLVDEAYELETNRRLRLWIEPPLDDAEKAGMHRPCAGCERRRLAVRSGRLVLDRGASPRRTP
jgi:hypothetical protein